MSARERIGDALRKLRGAVKAVEAAIHMEPLPSSTRASLEGTLLRLHQDEAFLRRDLKAVRR